MAYCIAEAYVHCRIHSVPGSAALGVVAAVVAEEMAAVDLDCCSLLSFDSEVAVAAVVAVVEIAVAETAGAVAVPESEQVLCLWEVLAAALDSKQAVHQEEVSLAEERYHHNIFAVALPVVVAASVASAWLEPDSVVLAWDFSAQTFQAF